MRRLLSSMLGAALAVVAIASPSVADPIGAAYATTGSSPRISGWARDPDITGPVDVHVYIQFNGTGALVFLTHATADQCSGMESSGGEPPDANGCWHHGFSMPYGALGSNHRLSVYALDNQHGEWHVSQLANSPLVVSNSPIATQTGVFVWDVDHDCPDKPAQIQVFVLDRTIPASPQWRLHGRGYTNAPTYPSYYYDYATFIAFKFPLPIDLAGGDILVRRMKRTDCTSDTWLSGGYEDSSPASPVARADEFRGYNRSINFETSDYKALADRNGGAIYEFYNLRMNDADLPNGQKENAIHAHNGAALQVAAISGYAGTPEIPNSCGAFGVWNPTQAGASCPSPYDPNTPLSPVPGDPVSDLNIYCGTDINNLYLNNACSSATTALWSEHRMMNWDYGPTKPGPYNLGVDTAKLTQTVDASHSNYLQVDITLKNIGLTHREGAFEIPTFYFTNRFRKFYHPEYNGALPSVPSFVFPDRPGVTDSGNANYQALGPSNPGVCFDPGWVTAENTFANSASNQFITIAWFYKGSFLDLPNPYTQACGPNEVQSRWHVAISEQGFTDTIKFTNAPRIDLVPGTPYEFRYVIFPYRWDDMIGTQTVAQMIAQMRAAYR